MALRRLRSHLCGATGTAGANTGVESSPGGHSLVIPDAAPGSARWLTAAKSAQWPTTTEEEDPTLSGRGAPYSGAETARIAADLQKDGYAVLGPTLSPEEVHVLRAAAERKQDDPRQHTHGNGVNGSTLPMMFEYDTAARDLIVREPFASLAEHILGGDCHIMAQNWIRNTAAMAAKNGVTAAEVEAAEARGGSAGDGWHIDDLCLFPLPPGTVHSLAAPPPIFVLQVFVLLTDVPTVAHGPTQFVPSSHLSGRKPTDEEQSSPCFGGRRHVSMLGKAGDAYIMTNQIWHRGHPNVTDSPRILGGTTYARRFVSQRFFPFVDYQLPAHVLQGASPRLQRMLGRHDKSNYA